MYKLLKEQLLGKVYIAVVRGVFFLHIAVAGNFLDAVLPHKSCFSIIQLSKTFPRSLYSSTGVGTES